MTSMATDGQSPTVSVNIPNQAYSATARPVVRIHLLGAMRATSYLGDDVLPRAKKARAALGYLCLAFGARVPRARIASMLWDRVSDDQARTSFRQALADLTSAMGCLAGELIATGRATIRLNTDACWIDALALLQSSSPDSTRADLALLCNGDLLEGLEDVSAAYGQWLRRERIRFKEKLKGSFDAVLQRIDRSDFDPVQLAAVARRLISFDPTHQAASVALMRALAKLGEPEEARREYERCRDVLMEIHRVKPSMESERLYERIGGRRARTSASGVPTVANGSRIERSLPVLLPERSRLRVGVLAFDADDCKNERSLALSLSHEIAAGLARFRWFDVITPAAPRRTLSMGFVGDRQHEYANLDYLVDGSISGSSDLQINVRLLDVAGQVRLVWGERFDIALRELHRLDELVTTRIVARIDPMILHIEGKPKRRARYGATGLLLLAIPMIFSRNANNMRKRGA